MWCSVKAYHADRDLQRWKQPPCELRFNVRWDVGRYAVLDYPGVKEYIY